MVYVCMYIYIYIYIYVLSAGKHCMRRPAVFLRRASCRRQRRLVLKEMLRPSVPAAVPSGARLLVRALQACGSPPAGDD